MTKAVSITNATTNKVVYCPTNIPELDNVCCGGLVPSAAYLISGEPGIGKSTLLLQVAASRAPCGKVLYASGEETIDQISDRAKRIGANLDNLFVISSNSVETILEQVKELQPTLLIIDSAQTIVSDNCKGNIGSVAQVKAIAKELVDVIKANNIILILVAQITKNRKIAGPKTIEHLVDCVLSFSQENAKRLLSSTKNRLGVAPKTGYFAMTGKGLISSPPTPQSKANDLFAWAIGQGSDVVKRSVKNTATSMLSGFLKKGFKGK